MVITIVGAGTTGTYLAKYLSGEQMDIFIVDTDVNKLMEIDAEYNLMTVDGDGTVFATLRHAEVEKCDLFISVTNIAERNIVACGMAKSMGAKMTVARVDRNDYLEENNQAVIRKMGVDKVIFPESLIAWKVFWRNDVFKTYVMIIVVFYIFIVFSIVNGGQYKGWQSVTVDPLFHIISALTSTGFGAGNYEGWGFLALTMTFFMMFVGACAGSTTGGLKIDRFLFFVKNMLFVMRRYVRPRLMKTVNINGQSVEPEKVNEIVAFISLFTILIVIGGVVLVAQGFPIVDAFF